MATTGFTAQNVTGKFTLRRHPQLAAGASGDDLYIELKVLKGFDKLWSQKCKDAFKTAEQRTSFFKVHPKGQGKSSSPYARNGVNAVTVGYDHGDQNNRVLLAGMGDHKNEIDIEFTLTGLDVRYILQAHYAPEEVPATAVLDILYLEAIAFHTEDSTDVIPFDNSSPLHQYITLQAGADGTFYIKLEPCAVLSNLPQWENIDGSKVKIIGDVDCLYGPDDGFLQITNKQCQEFMSLTCTDAVSQKKVAQLQINNQTCGNKIVYIDKDGKETTDENLTKQRDLMECYTLQEIVSKDDVTVGRVFPNFSWKGDEKSTKHGEGLWLTQTNCNSLDLAKCARFQSGRDDCTACAPVNGKELAEIGAKSLRDHGFVYGIKVLSVSRLQINETQDPATRLAFTTMVMEGHSLERAMELPGLNAQHTSYRGVRKYIPTNGDGFIYEGKMEIYFDVVRTMSYSFYRDWRQMVRISGQYDFDQHMYKDVTVTPTDFSLHKAFITATYHTSASLRLKCNLNRNFEFGFSVDASLPSVDKSETPGEEGGYKTEDGDPVETIKLNFKAYLSYQNVIQNMFSPDSKITDKIKVEFGIGNDLFGANTIRGEADGQPSVARNGNGEQSEDKGGNKNPDFRKHGKYPKGLFGGDKLWLDNVKVSWNINFPNGSNLTISLKATRDKGKVAVNPRMTYTYKISDGITFKMDFSCKPGKVNEELGKCEKKVALGIAYNKEIKSLRFRNPLARLFGTDAAGKWATTSLTTGMAWESGMADKKNKSLINNAAMTVNFGKMASYDMNILTGDTALALKHTFWKTERNPHQSLKPQWLNGSNDPWGTPRYGTDANGPIAPKQISGSITGWFRMDNDPTSEVFSGGLDARFEYTMFDTGDRIWGNCKIYAKAAIEISLGGNGNTAAILKRGFEITVGMSIGMEWRNNILSYLGFPFNLGIAPTLGVGWTVSFGAVSSYAKDCEPPPCTGDQMRNMQQQGPETAFAFRADMGVANVIFELVDGAREELKRKHKPVVAKIPYVGEFLGNLPILSVLGPKESIYDYALRVGAERSMRAWNECAGKWKEAYAEFRHGQEMKAACATPPCRKAGCKLWGTGQPVWGGGLEATNEANGYTADGHRRTGVGWQSTNVVGAGVMSCSTAYEDKQHRTMCHCSGILANPAKYDPAEARIGPMNRTLNTLQFAGKVSADPYGWEYCKLTKEWRSAMGGDNGLGPYCKFVPECFNNNRLSKLKGKYFGYLFPPQCADITPDGKTHTGCGPNDDRVNKTKYGHPDGECMGCDHMTLTSIFEVWHDRENYVMAEMLAGRKLNLVTKGGIFRWLYKKFRKHWDQFKAWIGLAATDTLLYCGGADPVLCETSMDEYDDYILGGNNEEIKNYDARIDGFVGRREIERMCGCLGTIGGDLHPEGNATGPFGSTPRLYSANYIYGAFKHLFLYERSRQLQKASILVSTGMQAYANSEAMCCCGDATGSVAGGCCTDGSELDEPEKTEQLARWNNWQMLQSVALPKEYPQLKNCGLEDTCITMNDPSVVPECGNQNDPAEGWTESPADHDVGARRIVDGYGGQVLACHNKDQTDIYTCTTLYNTERDRVLDAIATPELRGPLWSGVGSDVSWPAFYDPKTGAIQQVTDATGAVVASVPETRDLNDCEHVYLMKGETFPRTAGSRDDEPTYANFTEFLQDLAGLAAAKTAGGGSTASSTSPHGECYNCGDAFRPTGGYSSSTGTTGRDIGYRMRRVQVITAKMNKMAGYPWHLAQARALQLGYDRSKFLAKDFRGQVAAYYKKKGIAKLLRKAVRGGNSNEYGYCVDDCGCEGRWPAAGEVNSGNKSSWDWERIDLCDGGSKQKVDSDGKQRWWVHKYNDIDPLTGEAVVPTQSHYGNRSNLWYNIRVFAKYFGVWYINAGGTATWVPPENEKGVSCWKNNDCDQGGSPPGGFTAATAERWDDFNESMVNGSTSKILAFGVNLDFLYTGKMHNARSDIKMVHLITNRGTYGSDSSIVASGRTRVDDAGNIISSGYTLKPKQVKNIQIFWRGDMTPAACVDCQPNMTSAKIGIDSDRRTNGQVWPMPDMDGTEGGAFEASAGKDACWLGGPGGENIQSLAGGAADADIPYGGFYDDFYEAKPE